MKFHIVSHLVPVAHASHQSPTFVPELSFDLVMAYATGGGGPGEGKTNGFSTGGEEDSLDSHGSRERKESQACALLESGKRSSPVLASLGIFKSFL